MTINTNETANPSSLNNQDDNIGVLASEKTVSILSTTNKEGVSQKPKLKNNETSNHTIDDLTLKVHELTTIPVTPIPKLPDIYADSSTVSNNNPLRNNKRVKGDESPNSDGSHPSSQHGQYVTVSNKKAEKRRKKKLSSPQCLPQRRISISLHPDRCSTMRNFNNYKTEYLTFLDMIISLSILPYLLLMKSYPLILFVVNMSSYRVFMGLMHITTTFWEISYEKKLTQHSSLLDIMMP
jgi:hypothetical protein